MLKYNKKNFYVKSVFYERKSFDYNKLSRILVVFSLKSTFLAYFLQFK